MPRQERTKSGTGIYHVMLRGINKQDMFEDDEDYLQMTSIKTKMITEPSLGHFDLSGKNVMVFTTHEGSGLADAISVIRQQEPQASVNATGFQTRGASAGSQSNAINEWLNGLGYK